MPLRHSTASSGAGPAAIPGLPRDRAPGGLAGGRVERIRGTCHGREMRATFAPRMCRMCGALPESCTKRRRAAPARHGDKKSTPFPERITTTEMSTVPGNRHVVSGIRSRLTMAALPPRCRSCAKTDFSATFQRNNVGSRLIQSIQIPILPYSSTFDVARLVFFGVLQGSGETWRIRVPGPSMMARSALVPRDRKRHRGSGCAEALHPPSSYRQPASIVSLPGVTP